MTDSADVLGFIVQACRRLRGPTSCLCGMHGAADVAISDPTLVEWGAIQATGKELEWNLFALRERILGSPQTRAEQLRRAVDDVFRGPRNA